MVLHDGASGFKLLKQRKLATEKIREESGERLCRRVLLSVHQVKGF